MSYTQKKVSWERCNRAESSDENDTFLLDSFSQMLYDDNEEPLKGSIESYTPTVNEYGDQVVEDEYGDISRRPPVQVLVRKQPHEDVINIAEGKTVLTKSIFYVDPAIEPNALNIRYMDKLDGETVIQRYVMCTRSNKPKMVRYITV